jgi:hypothetical protein
MENLFAMSEHDFYPSWKAMIYFVNITAKTKWVIVRE